MVFHYPPCDSLTVPLLAVLGRSRNARSGFRCGCSAGADSIAYFTLPLIVLMLLSLNQVETNAPANPTVVVYRPDVHEDVAMAEVKSEAATAMLPKMSVESAVAVHALPRSTDALVPAQAPPADLSRCTPPHAQQLLKQAVAATTPPADTPAPYISTMVRDAMQSVSSSVAGISVLTEETGIKLLNLALAKEVPSSFSVGMASDGKPIMQLTNFRIYEKEVTKLHHLGGEPGRMRPTSAEAISGLGTVVAGSERLRVTLADISGWKISMQEGFEGAWVGTASAWYQLQQPDSSYSAIFEKTKLRLKLCQSIVVQLKEDATIGPVAVATKLYEESSGAAKDSTEWWLWRMRQDRSFIISFLKEHALDDTAFCKVRTAWFLPAPDSPPVRAMSCACGGGVWQVW